MRLRRRRRHIRPRPPPGPDRESSVDRRRFGLPCWPALYAVGGVEDHGDFQILHRRDGPEVVDELSVAERGAAFSVSRNGVLPASASLVTTFFMSPGAANCPSMSTTRPVSAAATEEVGLAGEEGRDLQDVDDLGRRSRLAGIRGCRYDGEAGLASRSWPVSSSPSTRPGPRKEVDRGAIGSLSNEPLKTSGILRSPAICASRIRRWRGKPSAI